MPQRDDEGNGDQKVAGSTMSNDAIKIEHRGRVTLMTIQRPEVMNALDDAAQRSLSSAFDDFARDDDQWVAILTGTGQAFCSGHDLRSDPKGLSGLPEAGFGGLTARFGLDKPVLAAVNGFAVGGGFELVLACDIVVAAPDAVFGLPEVTVGVAALGGGILRLTRLAGHQQAMGMLLTGRRVRAAEGLAMGFVTEIVDDGDVVAAAMRWADCLNKASPMAVRATKAVARDQAGLVAAMALQWEHPAIGRLLSSEDAREGPAAFREKRLPRWTGR